MAKKSVFVGSSTESLPLAEAIHAHLSTLCDVTVWNHDFFELGQTTLDALMKTAASFDFAVFVLASDDQMRLREVDGATPRANVLFELGVFMAALGTRRVFPIYGNEPNLFRPSDLSGVTTTTFTSTALDKTDFVACKKATKDACDRIANAIRAHKPTPQPPPQPYLTARTAESVEAYLLHRREGYSLIIGSDIPQGVKQFEQRCQQAWGEAHIYDAIDKALNGEEFALYVSALGNSGPESTDRPYYLDCGIRRHKNSTETMLAKLLETDNEKEDTESDLTHRGFAHWLLNDNLSPHPLAVAVQCLPDDAWSARTHGLHDRPLVFTICAAKNEDEPGIKAAADNLRASFSFPGIESRLKSLRGIYKSSYMGKSVKSILLIPIQGRPGIVLQLLTRRPIRITGASLLSGPAENPHNDKQISVCIEELMAIRLGGERLAALLVRLYAEDKAIHPRGAQALANVDLSK